ncbi:hypothetical protein QJS10_CPA01g00897 [Acorus calamus]|uniref:RRM domain-containing protein n=1 Tax=Acorus calamus TaxID=4465 RepID=A0AAV9FJH9_ACOCL|nr:hypothetical protein QJS10_CPA01g00897 [Acorus calamus]
MDIDLSHKNFGGASAFLQEDLELDSENIKGGERGEYYSLERKGSVEEMQKDLNEQGSKGSVGGPEKHQVESPHFKSDSAGFHSDNETVEARLSIQKELSSPKDNAYYGEQEGAYESCYPGEQISPAQNAVPDQDVVAADSTHYLQRSSSTVNVEMEEDSYMDADKSSNDDRKTDEHPENLSSHTEFEKTDTVHEKIDARNSDYDRGKLESLDESKDEDHNFSEKPLSPSEKGGLMRSSSDMQSPQRTPKRNSGTPVRQTSVSPERSRKREQRSPEKDDSKSLHVSSSSKRRRTSSLERSGGDSRRRSRTPRRTPSGNSHRKDDSPRKRSSASPHRRRSPRRRSKSASRSPVRRRDSPSGRRRDRRDRSRSRSPYARDRSRRSPRGRRSHSPRRRSPPSYHSRHRSPRRRPWSPPPNRNTGVGKPGRNLFVAGFSFVTTERDLEKKFSKYGRVTDVRIVRDKRSGDSRGFGFLSLERDEDADAAIRALDQTEWNGRIVLVEKSKTSAR